MDLCYPFNEGGLGFKSLHDVSKTLFAKLWWKFRTSVDFVWGSYIWNKYCKKLHPSISLSRGGSCIWMKMTETTEEVDHDIWWQIKSGTSSFLFDNWTKLGDLYFLEELGCDTELKVKDSITN